MHSSKGCTAYTAVLLAVGNTTMEEDDGGNGGGTPCNTCSGAESHEASRRRPRPAGVTRMSGAGITVPDDSLSREGQLSDER